MLLEILNSGLTHTLHNNPHLVYSLLYQREVFVPFHKKPGFIDLVQNIEMASAQMFFFRKLVYLHSLEGKDVADVLLQYYFLYRLYHILQIVWRKKEVHLSLLALCWKLLENHLLLGQKIDLGLVKYPTSSYSLQYVFVDRLVV